MAPPTPRAEARIHVDASPEVARVLLASIGPEAETGVSDRSSARLVPDEGGVAIIIEADDVTALRAAVNSYLYWAQEVIDLGGRVGAGAESSLGPVKKKK